ncbi:MAG: FAD:protein FMN transferase [Saprospiraceae bacterium]|nr:MAG: FAD:protein FMN transferase [Saprospiraceae bacterium]
MGCESTPKSASATDPTVKLEGKTMGTYYQVTYLDLQGRDFQTDIDQLLEDINQEVSTYIESSTISRINQADTSYTWPEEVDSSGLVHFMHNFEVAKKIFKLSQGNFDPTVMPLVNYWGFGYTEKKPVTEVDRKMIDSLITYVGFDKVVVSQKNNRFYLRKEAPGVQLDFSACAKGYGVDDVARLLESKGIVNYLVDIGGEARAKGQSPRGDHWKIGINVPQEDAATDDIQVAIPLVNQAVATSGNYRNFYEVNGVKYSHTINPKTGFPERSTLLSASVFAKDCITADAFATAFMVMGYEKAKEMATRLPELEAYFIFSQQDGSLQTDYTKGLKPLFQQ